ncbi:MAG: polysaccharide biosynthesis C-terminal domain-containing protein [Eubacterium sp.]|nr:polysaccharide biosynthesis C-terminal domain-containing protein [Eubacterium sp.]
METTVKNSLFGTGKFYLGALGIAVPIMLQGMIQSFVSLIDNFMVSGLGDISMSGVNISGRITFIFMVYIGAIGTSGGIFLTQYFGAGDNEGMSQAFRFKLIMGLAAFIPYFLVCFVFPRQVLSLLVIGNTDAELILSEAVKYIRIMTIVGPPMTVSFCIASCLRDMGRVKIPLVVTVVATLTNTLFNWLLIYGNLGFPRLGVEGAAYATLIARVVELIIFIVVYIRLKPPFRIRTARDIPEGEEESKYVSRTWLGSFFRVDGRIFKNILKKGSFVLFCEMVWIISETVTTAIYNGRGGADVVSGMAASFVIGDLFFVAFEGIYSVVGVILGKALGSGDLAKARREKTWLLSGAAVFGFFMTGVALLTTFLVPVVFGRLSADAVSICRSMIIIMACFMPIWVYMNAQQAVSRSGGDTFMGAVGDVSVTVLIMIPLVLILGIFTSVGPVMLFLYIKLLDFIKVFIFHLWLKKERWLRNLTLKV